MRLLVIEDEAALGEQLAGGLREEHHVVDLVRDGREALHYTPLLHEGRYDAVVLDVLLPGCDGWTLCRRWRGDGLRVPILMLTARQAVEDRVEGLDAGADDYLTKPFAFAELLARLRALDRRPADVRVGPLRHADLVLDPVTHRVERAGRTIRLTAREYTILELLLRHRGQVLSRDQIAAGAWDLGADHASNVVDVFIGTLRRKVDGAHAQKLLQTVRGVGYVLREPAGAPTATRAAGGQP